MKLTTQIRRLFAVLCVITLLCSIALAQGGATGPAGQTTKGAVIKGRAPVNKTILSVKLPKAEEATLSNGMRVMLLENHKVPTFTVQMVILSGGLADKPDYRGLAQFTAALLREGTTTRSSRDIAEQVDALGATLVAGSGLASITTNVSTSIGHVEQWGANAPARVRRLSNQ